MNPPPSPPPARGPVAPAPGRPAALAQDAPRLLGLEDWSDRHAYRIHGYDIQGGIVGRSQEVDSEGRRCYLFFEPLTGNLYLVSGKLLREA